MGTAASTLWLTTYEGHMDPGAKALSGTKKVKCIASAGPAVMAREAIYYKALLNGPEKAQEISKDLTGKELPIGPARAISGFTMGVLTAFPDNLATQARGFFMQNPTQFNLAKLTKTGFRGTVSRGVYGAAVSLSFLSAKNSAMMAMEEVQP